MGVYGTQDHLECLSYPALPPDVAPFAHTCLGYRYSVDWAGVPYGLTDHGYVFTTNQGKQYVSLSEQEIETFQSAGILPKPLPPYEIPLGWRIGAYSAHALVTIIVLFAAFKLWQRRRLKRDLGSTEITTSGPTYARKGDRAISEAIREHLDPGELVSHQALAYDRKPDSIGSSIRGNRHFAALTNKRLILVSSKIGMFGWFQGKPWLTTIERPQIARVDADGEQLVVHRRDGTNEPLLVPLNVMSYSNQRAFLLDLPRVLPDRA